MNSRNASSRTIATLLFKPRGKCLNSLKPCYVRILKSCHRGLGTAAAIAEIMIVYFFRLSSRELTKPEKFERYSGHTALPAGEPRSNTRGIFESSGLGFALELRLHDSSEHSWELKRCNR